jgi:protein subunit release factor A
MGIIEIRSADGGLDAEMFATELTGATSRALTRDGIPHEVDGTTLSLQGVPSWL